MSNPTSPGPGDLTPEKQALLALRKMRARLEELERAAHEPIAIVGMACRFPGGATSPEAYWTLLRDGRDAVSEVPADRWDIDAFYDPDPDARGKMYTRAGAFLRDIDRFDAAHFGITPREARTIDPQQRLLLELTWEALEDAGYAPDGFTGRDVGVFVGISINDYGQLLVQAREADSYAAGTGNLLSAAAGRLSYILGFQGPAMALDTACSSSLSAVHLACQSLRTRESQLAIAGGVNVMLNPDVTVNCCRARMLSPRGRCSTFDAEADGYVRGEGCGVVVLKRLSDAVDAGDRILALIRGSAVNQDGRSGGFTAPNELAQQAVITKALRDARVAPADISYVEAHGTGTALGDPIEMHAIAAALGPGRAADAPLVVGSVKTNIGHLESAAGMAGLMKVVLALRHREIPPHLHFRALNPHIDVNGVPIVIPTSRTEWTAGAGPRLAGLSSFGFTGTNAHVILQEAPAPQPRAASVDRPSHVLALSARTDPALREMAARFAELLRAGDAALADVCFTANSGRARFDHRLALVVDDGASAAAALADIAAGRPAARVRQGVVRKSAVPDVTFLFTGQGAQYAGMGRELYESAPEFRRALDECDALLRDQLERPLLSVMYPSAGETSPIDDTAYAQPALFAIEYALAALWRSWGVEPGAVLGHSIGEFAAACVAGVLTLPDALRLVAARGRLMQALPRNGAMAAVLADGSATRRALADDPRVSIAALNGPENTVISGDAAAVDAALERLAAAGVKSQRLTVSHAFHSGLMDPMLGEFERIAASIAHAPAKLTFVSTLEGAALDPSFTFGGAYWRRHAREAVRFADGMRALHAQGQRLFLEIGPSPTLLGMARRVVADDAAVWLPSLRKGRPAWSEMLGSAAELFTRGIDLDWPAFDRPYGRSRVTVPTYPFERQRHWLGAAPPVPAAASSAPAVPSWIDDRLYRLAWIADERTADPSDRPRAFVLIADADDPLAAGLQRAIEGRGDACRMVTSVDDASWMDGASDVALVAGGDARPGCDDPAALDRAHHVTRSLLAIAQAAAARPAAARPRVWAITANTQPVVAGDSPSVAASPLWGLGRVVALEHPEIWGGLIDLDSPDPPGDTLRRVAGDLRGVTILEDQIAYRAGRRYVARLEPAAAPAAAPLALRADATYVITGGFGSLGLHTAERLVRRGARHIALAGRRGVPPRAEWAAVDPSSDAGRRIAAVQRLEGMGATVHVYAADIGRRDAVGQMFARLAADAPPIRGIFHAAGVARAAAISDLTPDGLAALFDAKVGGTWWLHQASLSLPIDHFVLYSSISSVWGSKTLASYAAANHFLDAVAHHRRAGGLPALSVNWGPWAGGGMVDAQGEKWLALMGVAALPPGPALDALERLMGGHAAQVVVADVAWDRFLPVYEAKGSRPLVERLRGAAAASAAPASSSAGDAFVPGLVQALTKLPEAERRDAIARAVRRLVARVVGADDPEAIGDEDGLFDMGMDSLMATELRRVLEKQFERSLSPTVTFDYPSVAALAGHLDEQLGIAAAPAGERIAAPHPHAAADHREIAIVGMSCRFPGGADTPEAFWDLLRHGQHAVTEVPPDRWDADRYYDPDPDAPGRTYARHGGFVDGVDRFDAGFFGISPREADSMDPQHRLLLEVTWEAFERGGQNPSALRGSRTGVFVGISNSEYAQIVAAGGAEYTDAYLMTGNGLNFAAGRLSYILGLQGPALAVDTACSSSLTAIHLACRSLRDGDCDMAVAGGVNLILQPDGMVVAAKAGMLSAAGVCRTFDAAADGIVRAEGCGILILKPLQAALDAGDPILAVIRGSAMNQDGRSSGITVPNGLAQEALLRDALRDAAVDARDISYVEAHGTGTRLGDPIEVRALDAVLGGARSSRPLLVGSVKTNIGHAESAAGAAGLIKTVLALQHGEIPPHLHLRELNPDITVDPGRVAIPTAATVWAGERKLAGVSSFGASGTNVHVVVEQGPAAIGRDREPAGPHLFTLSARDEAALEQQIDRVAAALAGTRDSLADICHTANAGRAHFAHRLAILAHDMAELRAVLPQAASSADPRVMRGRATDNRPPRVAFVFRGGDVDEAAIERASATDAAFRAAYDRCREIAGPRLNRRFAFEYALAETWRAWGVQPAGVVGEGTGELVAACVAGAISLDDALRLAAVNAGDRETLERIARAVSYAPSRLTFASAATGECAAPALAFTSGTVLNAAGSAKMPEAIAALRDKGLRVVLEVGATRSREDRLRALAAMYVDGASIAWAQVSAEGSRHTASLPTYPFQRTRHWIAAADGSRLSDDEAVAAAAARSAARRRTGLTRRAVLEADPEGRLALVQAFCAEQVGAVLRIQGTPVGEPLNNLGVDSLMAIELRNRIQRALDVSVAVGVFLDGTTVEGLAAAVMESLDGADGAGAGPAAAPGRLPADLTPEQAQRLLGQLEELSDAEVERLLGVLSAGS
ncbi:MAG TPA: SDR family NAD(P)-dependent oxidoreductase [Vicinamibacterales bacterium]|nr:SDR family NAD(P)-dependent oxidoreductase [Vicinamibacterales bacterium]